MSAKVSSLLIYGLILLSPFVVGAADWPTFGHDPQRSGWAREESILTPENVKGLELKWKVHLKNEARFLSALTAPVVASGVVTSQGLKTLIYVAGSSNVFYALDAINGNTVWSRTFDSRLAAVGGPLQGSFLCPNGITATPAIDRGTNTIYVIGMDGRLYGLNLATGKDNFLPPIPFVAPFSKNLSLNIVDGIVYTALSQGCGDGPSGLYSIDVRSPHHAVVRRLVMSSNIITSGIWGRGGPVVGENHCIYGQTADGAFDAAAGEFGSSFVAALLPEMNLADYFSPKNHDYINKHDLDMGSASPVWFTYQGQQLLAGGGKEGVVYLMDAKSLGGKGHETAIYVTPRLGNDAQVFEQHGIWGAISYWQSREGDNWIYVPMWGPVSKDAPAFPVTNGLAPHGSIMAFKVGLGKGDKNPILQSAWVSGDFNLPDPPAIANGVVFALSTGENAEQRSSDRTKNTRPAVLRALDAKTGKELWNSANAMSAWVHFSGLAISDGRVYAVDQDSWLYSFGLKEQ